MQPDTEELSSLSSTLSAGILNAYGIRDELVPGDATANVDHEELATLAILCCQFLKMNRRVAKDRSFAIKSTAFISHFIFLLCIRFETDNDEKVLYVQ